jgi:hypothetical protein
MSFSDPIKLKVKRKAHFQCCLCKAVYVEVHHIVPTAEDGPDTIDNAAPLCPSCHENYGANPTKRKFIREVRDFWYEICADRFKGDSTIFEKLSDSIQEAATKKDLTALGENLEQLIKDTVNQPQKNTEETKKDIAQLSGMLASTGRHCKKCNTSIGLLIGDQGYCPQCGSPW